ncbi:hypothetical protein MRX96_001368 [Rhipicephalus microplus]
MRAAADGGNTRLATPKTKAGLATQPDTDTSCRLRWRKMDVPTTGFRLQYRAPIELRKSAGLCFPLRPVYRAETERRVSQHLPNARANAGVQ